MIDITALGDTKKRFLDEMTGRETVRDFTRDEIDEEIDFITKRQGLHGKEKELVA